MGGRVPTHDGRNQAPERDLAPVALPEHVAARMRANPEGKPDEKHDRVQEQVEAPLGSGRLVLDLRSVNHRHLDVRVRVPQDIADQSLFVEQRARERLTRGRFELSVRYEGPALVPRLDADRASLSLS